jgi:hypothetical protein
MMPTMVNAKQNTIMISTGGDFGHPVITGELLRVSAKKAMFTFVVTAYTADLEMVAEFAPRCG